MPKSYWGILGYLPILKIGYEIGKANMMMATATTGIASDV